MLNWHQLTFTRCHLNWCYIFSFSIRIVPLLPWVLLLCHADWHLVVRHQSKALGYGYGYSTGVVSVFVHAYVWDYAYMCLDRNSLQFIIYNVEMTFICIFSQQKYVCWFVVFFLSLLLWENQAFVGWEWFKIGWNVFCEWCWYQFKSQYDGRGRSGRKKAWCDVFASSMHYVSLSQGASLRSMLEGQFLAGPVIGVVPIRSGLPAQTASPGHRSGSDVDAFRVEAGGHGVLKSAKVAG